MKKILGIPFGGFQKKAVGLALIPLVAAVVVFVLISTYQNSMLSSVIHETQGEQQQAISQSSEETMRRMLESSLVNTVALQADIADADFSEIVNNLNMLRSMAEDLFENRENHAPAPVALPDAAMDGVSSAMVLCEEGVDPEDSELLGLAANLSSAMIAMHKNSEKIDGCYIGLTDGTDLCVDDKAASKLDENGDPIPFPVRERPWYRGAVENNGLYFTGVETDLFSGRILITCSVPIMARGELVGVAGIDIVLEGMNDFLRSAAESEGVVFIVNHDRQVILSSDGTGILAAEASNRERNLSKLGNEKLTFFVDRALEEKTDLNIITLEGRRYYMAGAPMLSVGWAVISVMDKELTQQPEQQLLARYDEINAAASSRFRTRNAHLQWVTLAVFTAVFILVVLAAVRVARKMVRPIELMTQGVIQSGETGEPFRMQDSFRTNDEIEMLAASFEDLSVQTKQYIENITDITREKERINTELHMAGQIQNSMLPQRFPPFPDHEEFDIYAVMDPAREVGGDFYDFFFIDDDHLCLVMADVSGKGIPAALFMMISKVILQSCAMLGKNAAEILTKTNEALCSNNQVEMFVTVWLGILELSTGMMTCANAGHEYPALKRADGQYELFKDTHGFVIGGMPEMRYREYQIRLEPGDKLFVYTDGVPEATDENKELFGTDRMLDALNEKAYGSQEETLRSVRRAVDDFVRDAEQFDDLTMLGFEYRGKVSR